MDIRNNNSHLSDKEINQEELLEKSKNEIRKSPNKTDALEYCSRSIVELMKLSNYLLKYSPVKSDIIAISEDMIVIKEQS